MNDQAVENGYSLISKYIYDISGIIIPPEKYYMIDTRLTKLMFDTGVDNLGDYYKVIACGDPKIDQSIINAITVNETFWFRDESLWKCFEQEILPGFIDRLRDAEKNRIRIWSAAASTGQEAYSIAMCIDNYLKKNNIQDIKLTDFEILATDISSRVIEIAKTGKYDKVSMTRGLSDFYKETYFKNNGSVWELDQKIRDAVEFRHLNLNKSYSGIGKFDIIFCRYVLIYFPDELKEKIVTKIKDTLNDNGVLFTGIYVILNILGDSFNTETYDNLTYYTKIPPKQL